MATAGRWRPANETRLLSSNVSLETFASAELTGLCLFSAGMTISLYTWGGGGREEGGSSPVSLG